MAYAVNFGRLLRLSPQRPSEHGVPFEDLQRFFSSWSKHLGERQDILVGTPAIPNLIQFYKRYYKTRLDVVVFRFRNADQSKKHFSAVAAALEKHKVDFRGSEHRHRVPVGSGTATPSWQRNWCA